MTKPAVPIDEKTSEEKFLQVMKEFLALREWDDELDINVESKIVSLDTGLGIGGLKGRLVIEALEDIEVIDAFIYFKDLRCKPAKKMEMAWLFQKIFRLRGFGRLELLETEESGILIRWRHRVDFEGSTPSGKSVSLLFQPGWDLMGEFADCISAVALTKQTAEEAFAEWEEAQRAAEEAARGVPKEL